jgi:Transposase DDE domain
VVPVTGLDEEQEQAVALLALVAGQDVEPGEAPGSWRIARAVATDRVVSTVDPQSRHVHKTVREHRDGFKAHLAVEPETGLITANDLTAGNASDGPVGVALLQNEPEPVQVLGDSAYGAGPTRAALVEAGHELVIKPLPLRPAVPGGFTRDDFAVDHSARTVTCPAGITLPLSAKGNATFGARCRGCALRRRCTTAKAGRSLHATAHDDQLVAARAAAATDAFQADYRRWRPMAERAIAWIIADNHRRVRYRGITRNQLWLSLRVAAVNLRRLLTLGLQPTPSGWAIT